MKKLFVALMFFAVSSTPAQENRPAGSLQFGANAAFYGRQNVRGINIYGEFVQPLTSYLSVVPRVYCGYASDFKHTPYYNKEYYMYHSSFGGSLAARYSPTQKILNRISVDVGLAFLNTISFYGIQRQIIVVDDKITYSPGHADISYYSETYFAFTGSICIDVIKTSRINSGVRFDYLNSFSEDQWKVVNSEQVGIYFGVKL